MGIESYAEIADYFRVGLMLDLIDEAEVRNWAFGVIADESEPPHELIEVAWCKGLAALLGTLKDIAESSANSDGGVWLLHRLRSEDLQTLDTLARAIRRAMNVCRLSNLPEDLYYLFDGLDDGLYLARTGAWGDVDEVRRDFRAALEANAKAPPDMVTPGVTSAQ